MDTSKTVLLINCLLMLFNPKQQPTVPADAIKGDFDGDGKTEYAWLIKPVINADNTGCNGACTARLVFSKPGIPTITLDNSIGGKLTNLGDLNNDGKDDIGLLPDWFNGCWRSYFTYTLKTGKWTYLVDPFPTHCNQWENNITPIEKIAGKKGYLKINYSVFEKDSIVTRPKIVMAK